MQLQSLYELTLNGSSAIQRFKHSNVIKIHDRITFDFYTGLPDICADVQFNLTHLFNPRVSHLFGHVARLDKWPTRLQWSHSKQILQHIQSHLSHMLEVLKIREEWEIITLGVKKKLAFTILVCNKLHLKYTLVCQDTIDRVNFFYCSLQ